jgi:MFS family permease
MSSSERGSVSSSDQKQTPSSGRGSASSGDQKKTPSSEQGSVSPGEHGSTVSGEQPRMPHGERGSASSGEHVAAPPAAQGKAPPDAQTPAPTGEHQLPPASGQSAPAPAGQEAVPSLEQWTAHPGADEELRSIERHNLIVNVAEGGVYISSTAFVSPQTVMPALLTRLGGSNVEIGLLNVLTYAGAYIPQLFAARYVEALPWKKRWSISFGTGQRMMVLLMGLLVLLFGGDPRGSVLWTFLLLFLLNYIIGGIATPGWFDLFAKLTAAKKRGRLVGIRNSLGGLGAFICGFVLTWLLATFAFPVNYAVGFFIAFLLQITSIVLQGRFIEKDPSPVLPRRSMVVFLREIPGLIKADREFGRFLVASAFLVVAMVPSGFFTVYALRDFPLKGYPVDDVVVGHYTLAMVAIQVVGALVVGFVTDRYGNKLALLCTSGAMLLSSTWALLAPTPGWFTLVYIFFGITLGGEMLVRFNLAIEYCTPQLRSSYVGLMNTVLAPCYLAGLAGGIISDAVGYKGVFILGMLASVIGIYLLVVRVRDPREAHA